MKTLFKIFGSVFILSTLVISGILFYVDYQNNKPIVFNQKVWQEKDTYLIDNQRYNMVTYLIKTKYFADKTHYDIVRKLGNSDFEKDDKTKLRYVIKQKNNNFLLGFDPPTDVACLEIYFEYDIVKTVLIKERKDASSPFETTILFQKFK